MAATTSAALIKARHTQTSSGRLQADLRRCPVDVSGQRGGDVLGVAVDTAQRVGGERPLELEPYVHQAGVSQLQQEGDI